MLTSAVRKVLQGRNRLEQVSFRTFRAYHSFTARFTSPNTVNKKGSVEGLAGYARRNYLVPVPEAASIEELNARLLAQYPAYGSRHVLADHEQSVAALHEAEREHLLALPAALFGNSK
ncbi:hypothetical protein [Desulfofustis glycolicus]|uniref:Uncharacterized protein n=1 Tax=Desulfofustis glycolicus DSM 9705 TaxID=1121409 RepID=A0A1M5YVQ8_9BACT|nr:hypothetical protein [Desulfofustis glycolicus]MCB2214830.1 hypothetical protein [Desulfobulbaceae bacterium]SHI15633.1 hypothetical protein SAMN02745124_04460 [Desulfofustis glycolicus DSM 9705]